MTLERLTTSKISKATIRTKICQKDFRDNKYIENIKNDNKN